MSNFFTAITSVFSTPSSPPNPKHQINHPSPLSSNNPSTASSTSTLDTSASTFPNVTRNQANTATQLLTSCQGLTSLLNQKKATADTPSQLLSRIDAMISTVTLPGALAGGTSTCHHHLMSARRHIVARANHVAYQHMELVQEFITSTRLHVVGQAFPGSGQECLEHLRRRLADMRDMLMRPLVGVGYKRRMVHALRHDERYAVALRWVVEGGEKGERVWEDLKRYIVRLEECIVEEHWIAVEESVEELIEWTEWWLLRAMQRKTTRPASSIRRQSIVSSKSESV